MRNFILAKGLSEVVKTNLDFTEIPDGKLGIFTHAIDASTKKPVSVKAADASVPNKLQLVLGRTGNAGPVVLPIHRNGFEYVKMTPIAATTFGATVTVTNPAYIGDYTIIIAKKGVPFNERNKWTSTVFIDDTVNTTAEIVANKLVNAINANSISHDVTAAWDEDDEVMTITANTAGVDYEIILADCLSASGASVVVDTIGSPAQADAAYVTELARMAAADAGYRDTYMDANTYMYPDFPLNPLKGSNATDYGFTIYTLKFAEPRDTKTVEDVVNQIVQIAIPYTAANTPAGCVAELDALLAKL